MGNFTGVSINKVNGGLVRDSRYQRPRHFCSWSGGSEIGKLEYYKPVSPERYHTIWKRWDGTISIDLENKERCIIIPAKSSACLRNVSL